jgi:hypothetical protein
MHSESGSPVRTNAADAAYDNGKTKAKKGWNAQLVVVVLAVVTATAVFGFLVYELWKLTYPTPPEDNEVAEKRFWKEYVKPDGFFSKVIPKTQLTAERHTALFYGLTPNVRQCADKCLADEKCGAFSWVKPYRNAPRNGLHTPTRCVLLGEHFSTVTLDAGTVFMRNKKHIKRAAAKVADVEDRQTDAQKAPVDDINVRPYRAASA